MLAESKAHPIGSTRKEYLEMKARTQPAHGNPRHIPSHTHPIHLFLRCRPAGGLLRHRARAIQGRGRRVANAGPWGFSD